MDASSSQRKRRGGDDDRLPSKPRPASSSLPRGEKGPAASEEDVEEFFAILRRMRDASQSVAVGRGTAASDRWRPSFEWEDFFGGGAEKVACEGGDGARAVTPAVDEEAKRPQGIDLNADPGPEAEGEAVPSPLGEYTALSVLPPAVS
ncbi:protein NEGATIVE REGULATOR OF RESISTANCE-like [Zingiber officinale]|nr:protein NEGATIVE REGULATOR OF RESISTANCE-like [Zingiber officinale]